MKIDRDTYELAFIDFLEGRLEETDWPDFVAFLDQNPDLEEELKLMTQYTKSKAKLEKDTEPADLKLLLKRDSLMGQTSNFDELCISFYEGLLSEKEEQLLFGMLEDNPHLESVFNAYSKSYLNPDLSLTYPYKNNLKKRTVALRTSMFAPVFKYIAAASVILLVVLFAQLYYKADLPQDKALLSQTIDANTTVMKQSRGLKINRPLLSVRRTVAASEVASKSQVLAHKAKQIDYTIPSEDIVFAHNSIKAKATNLLDEKGLFSAKGKLALIDEHTLFPRFNQVFKGNIREKDSSPESLKTERNAQEENEKMSFGEGFSKQEEGFGEEKNNINEEIRKKIHKQILGTECER